MKYQNQRDFILNTRIHDIKQTNADFPVNTLTSIVGESVRINGPSPTPSEPMLKGVGTGEDSSSCAVVVCIIRSSIVDSIIIVICCESESVLIIFMYLFLQ